LDREPRQHGDLGLAASGADIHTIDGILISHLHIDHMADLSAVVKSMYFQARQAGDPRPATNPVRIYGPNENLANAQTKQFPSSVDYVDALYNISNTEKPLGIERYMHSFTTAISGGQFAYTVTNLPLNLAGATYNVLTTADGLVVKSIGVFHGPVPSVAFRIEYKGHSIVYTGDTNSKLPPPPASTGALAPGLIALSTDADLLIYDTAITDTEPNIYAGDPMFFQLHTTPTTMGQVSAQARAKTLVLSHITPITSDAIDEVKTLVRAQGYTGKIKVAKDLKVYNLGADDHDD